MPRRDYKRYFARDRNGNYAGTEPEREWDADELQRTFGMYQDMELRSIPGGSEFGEGAESRKKSERGSVGSESVDGDEGARKEGGEEKKDAEMWWE